MHDVETVDESNEFDEEYDPEGSKSSRRSKDLHGTKRMRKKGRRGRRKEERRSKTKRTQALSNNLGTGKENERP